MTALAPDVRGRVFVAIANLLHTDSVANDDDRTKLKVAAEKTWEMLEDLQILPTLLLDQYSSLPEPPARKGLAFPPSSTALVSVYQV